MSKFLTVLLVWALCSPWLVLGQVKPGWEAEWENTVTAAKKEGKLSVFLYRRDNIETAVRAFKKKYPEIKITTVATSAPANRPSDDGRKTRQEISLGYMHMWPHDTL